MIIYAIKYTEEIGFWSPFSMDPKGHFIVLHKKGSFVEDTESSGILAFTSLKKAKKFARNCSKHIKVVKFKS